MSGGTRSDEDFAREVEAHLQLEADRLIEDGLSPRRRALRGAQAFRQRRAGTERFYYSSARSGSISSSRMSARRCAASSAIRLRARSR